MRRKEVPRTDDGDKQFCIACLGPSDDFRLYCGNCMYNRILLDELSDRYRNPLPQPTDAFPGSPDKVDVLTRRLQNGEELFHPFDPVLPNVRRRYGDR